MSRSRPSRFLLLATMLAAALVVGGALFVLRTDLSALLLPPQVLRVSPPPGAAPVAPTEPFTVTFGVPMDRLATENAVRITPGTPGVFEWPDDRTLVFIPTARWPLSTTVSVSIQSHARSALLRALEQEYNWMFTTVGPPRLLASNPTPNATFLYAGREPALTFDREMDRASVEARLRVVPSIQGSQLVWQGNRLTLRGVLRPGASYRLMLARGSQDAGYGLKIGDDIEWSFTATAQYPLLAFTRPGRFTALRADLPANLPAQFMNVTSLQARLDGLDLNAIPQLLAAPREDEGVMLAGHPFKSWTTTLHSEPDRYGELQLPLGSLPPGLYLLTLRSPETPPLLQVLVSARTALTIKRGSGSVMVWAVRLADGRPIPHLPLLLLDAEGKQLAVGETDAQGLYEGPLSEVGRRLYVLSSDKENFGMAADEWQAGIESWRWPELKAQAGVRSADSPHDAFQAHAQVSVAYGRDGYIAGDAITATVSAATRCGARVLWTLFGQDYADGTEDGAPSSTAGRLPPLREAARGEGRLDPQGRYQFTLPFQLDASQPSQRLTLEALVIGNGQTPESGSGGAIVHRAGFYIAASPDAYVVEKGERAAFHVRTLDARGGPLARTILQYALYRADWKCGEAPLGASGESGGCTESRTPISAGHFITDAGGKYDLSFAPGRGGQYILQLTGADARSNRITATARLLAAAQDEFVPWRLDPGHRLAVQLDHDAFHAGDTARLLVQSPYARATALVTLERERVLWRRVMALQSNSEVIQLPLEGADGPLAYVSVLLLPADGAVGDYHLGYALLRVLPDGYDGTEPEGADQPTLGVETGSTLTVLR